jgi:hypothetical protein
MRPCPPMAILILVLMSVTTPSQAGIRLEVDPNDTPLRLTGWVAETNVFVGNLRLTSQGGDVDTLIFLPSDLQREGGDEIIGRQQVTLDGDLTLAPDIPKDFQVKIASLTVPGTYKGTVKFLLPGQAVTEALVVPLVADAKIRPALTPLPGTEQVQLRLVRCSWWLDCGLARLILPVSAFLDGVPLQFDTPMQAAVTVKDAKIVVVGDQARHPLSEQALTLPQGKQTLPAGQLASLPLAITRQAIPPDRYTGAIYLTLEGKEERLKVPIDLSVRTGPLWPMLLVLVGILLGRLFKYMQERGGPLSQALMAVNRVEARIQRVHPDDRQVLAPMIAAVRQLVYREQLEAVTGTLDSVEARLDALTDLRTMEAVLVGKEQHPAVKEALDKIKRVRQLLGLKQDVEARKAMDEVNAALAALKTTLMGPDQKPDAGVVQAAERAESARTAADRAMQAPSLPTDPAWLARLKRSLVAVSGLSEQIRAEATLWLVRPLLYVALLGGLLTVGINSLYVDKGVTFGVNSLSDYLILVVWGLTADVTSRSLSNLRGGSAG